MNQRVTWTAKQFRGRQNKRESYMSSIWTAPLFFLRLLYQSTYLALWQIWAKKTRSVLTTTGIVIGVASVTAVIASLTGLKAKGLSDLETFGAKTIWGGFQGH